MLTLLMLFWIGTKQSALTWYWWLWGIFCFIQFAGFLCKIYKMGKDGA